MHVYGLMGTVPDLHMVACMQQGESVICVLSSVNSKSPYIVGWQVFEVLLRDLDTAVNIDTLTCSCRPLQPATSA